MQETICILYTAKPLTFLPERSILFAKLVMNNRKEVLHDTRRILGDPNSLSRYKPWGRLCVLCLLYTSPSPRDVEESRMPSSA